MSTSVFDSQNYDVCLKQREDRRRNSLLPGNRYSQ